MHTVSEILDANPKRTSESAQGYARRVLLVAQGLWHDGTFGIAETVVTTYAEKAKEPTSSVLSDILIDLNQMKLMQRELLHIP